MNDSSAIAKVRGCLAQIKPDMNLDTVGDDTPLLEERVITSFDVVDLMLHLERASGQSISRTQLKPGSFRDFVCIWINVRMEPSQEMFRLESLGIMRGKMLQQSGVRRIHVKANCLRIQGLNFHGLATDKHETFWFLKNVFVHVQVVIPEHDVISGKRRAV